MRRKVSKPSLQGMLLASLGGHSLALVGLIVAANLSARMAPPPQNVLVTKLVRLGAPRPKELLPQKDPPPATPPPPAPPPPTAPPPQPASPAVAPAAAAAVAVPLQPKAPTAQERAASLSRVNKSLERLRRKVDGQATGAANGETDIAQEGDRWGTEVRTCVQKNYTIEGTDPSRTAGRAAVVIVRVEANGRIFDYTIKESSGLAAFDAAVGRAVRRCGQVSAPPAPIRARVRREGVEINFRP